MSNTITKKNFRAWLESFAPQKVVGRAGSNEDCPLAMFLGRNVRPVKLPQWALWFMTGVDHNDYRQKITAARALKIMDEIEK